MVKNGALAAAVFAALSISGHPALAGVICGPTGSRAVWNRVQLVRDDIQTASGTSSQPDMSRAGKVLNDFFANPKVRDLIAREVVGGLSVGYAGPGSHSPPTLHVFTNHGVDANGILYLTVAKAELPSIYEGSPVSFSERRFGDSPAMESPQSVAQKPEISNQDIARAQKALLDFSAMPGVKDLIANKTIRLIVVDYTRPPPELGIATDLNNGETVRAVEHVIPRWFDGFPVLVTNTQMFEDTSGGVFGTNPNRPGRAKQTNHE